MNLYRILGGLLTVALLTTACSSPESGNGGQPGGASGTLLVDSRLALRALDIDSANWGRELATGGDTLPVVNPADGNLYLARFTSGAVFTVQTYDPSGFTAIDGPVEWPETSLSTRINGLAFSPDGRHAAATIRHVGSDYLQVIDLATGEPQQLVWGFKDVTGNSLVWLNNEELAFSMDLGRVDSVPYDGAIVSVNVRDAAADTEPELTLIAGFGADSWNNPRSVMDLTLNAAGDELLYSLEGDLYVKDAPFTVASADPQQLTRGSAPHIGALFSPDGGSVAFVSYVEGYSSGIYVIPNHRGAAIEPNDSQLVLRTNVQRLVAWLP